MYKTFSQILTLKHVLAGDYVDRGIHGFEIVTYLMLLKLVHPKAFTVIAKPLNNSIISLLQINYLIN